MDGVTPLSSTTSVLYNPIRIPLIAISEVQADELKVLDYSVALRSWNQDVQKLKRYSKTVSGLAAVHQTFLFFSLLTRFVGHPIHPASIVRNGFVELDHPVIHDCLTRLKRRFSCLGPRKREAFVKEHYTMLDQAEQLTHIFDSTYESFAEENEHYGVIALAIRLLFDLLYILLEDILDSATGRVDGYLAYSCPGIFGPRGTDFRKSLTDVPHKEAVKRLLGKSKKHSRVIQDTYNPCPAATLLLKVFSERGWCSARAFQVCRTTDYATANYMASVQLPERRIEHIECETGSKCKAFTLDVSCPEIYPLKHFEHESCDEFLSNCFDDVLRIIKSGQIPLLSLSREGHDLDPKVIACTDRTHYIAVSHVWSDGLGNPLQNSLPMCQLRRLRNLLMDCDRYDKSQSYTNDGRWKSLWDRYRHQEDELRRSGRPMTYYDHKRINFWLDTICIPTSRDVFTNTDDQSIKLKAIKHITPIFAGAYRVLILDSMLEKVSFHVQHFNGEDIATIILSSTWMFRGWTLEEGVLAANCVFPLSDVFYDLHTAIWKQRQQRLDETSPLSRAQALVRYRVSEKLYSSLLVERRDISSDSRLRRVAFLDDMLRAPHFVCIWNSLCYRTTTRATDIPYILGNLLDFNIHPLKNVAAGDRLRTLLLHCNILPLSLLYNTGPRWHQPEYPETNWIPTDVTDCISSGGTLRRPDLSHRNSYKIAFDDSDAHAIILMQLNLDTTQSHVPTAFLVTAPQDHGVVVIQVEHPPSMSDLRKYPTHHQHFAPQSEVTMLLLVDFSCGFNGPTSHCGKGALLKVLTPDRPELHVSFVSALRVFSQEQWIRRAHDPSHRLPFMKHTKPAECSQLILNLGSTNIPNILIQRQPSSSYPPNSKSISFGIGILVWMVLIVPILLAIDFFFGEAFVEEHGGIMTWVLMCTVALAGIPADMIRRFVADQTYRKWINSFDDPEDIQYIPSISEQWLHAIKDYLGFFWARRMLRKVRGTPDGDIMLT